MFLALFMKITLGITAYVKNMAPLGVLSEG
jgi:hypothetical protein